MSNKLISKLVSKMKSDDITLFSKKELFKKEAAWTPTGIPQLDFHLGTLGFPVGLTEVYGISKSGKTTICLSGMSRHQKKYDEDAVCIILSSERRDNKEYATEMGVNVEDVIIIASKYIEDLIYKLINTLDDLAVVWKEEKREGKPRPYIMWDSIGNTLSRAEAETLAENAKIVRKNTEDGTKKELKHAQMGSFAKNAKQLMKGLIGRLYDEEIIMVAINHTIDDFNTGQKVSGGGGWKEFMPTLRLHVVHKELLKLPEKDGKGKDIEVEVGQISNVRIIKNDFGSRRVTEMPILFGYGVMMNDDDIKYLIEQEVLEMDGKTKVVFMDGKLSWTTKRTFYQLYREKSKYLTLLHMKLESLRHADVLVEKLKNSKNYEDAEIVEDEEDDEPVQKVIKRTVPVVQKVQPVVKPKQVVSNKPQVVVAKKQTVVVAKKK